MNNKGENNMTNSNETLNDIPYQTNTLPQNFYDVKEDGYYICNRNGEYVLKIDKDGNFHFINKEPSAFTNTPNNGFSIIDRLGNVVFRIDENGFSEFKINRQFALKLRVILNQL